MAQKSTIVSSGFIQLNMIPGAFEMPLQFNDGVTRQCLVVPIDGNDVVKRNNKNGGNKIIAGLNIFKNETPDQYGQTHYFRFSLTREAEARLDDQQKRNITKICGNAKPVNKQNGAAAPAAPAYQPGYAAPAQVQYPQGAPAQGQYPPQQGGYQNYPQQAPQAPMPPQQPMQGSARPAPSFGPAAPYTPYDDGDLPMGGNRGIQG